jgi:hypothetical protein
MAVLVMQAPAHVVSALAPADRAPTAATATATVDTVPVDTGDGYADNPFIPEDRSLGQCISSLPQPGCGSEAQGGWRQYLLLVFLVLGLGFIGWRVVHGARQQRAAAATSGSAGRGPERSAT